VPNVGPAELLLLAVFGLLLFGPSRFPDLARKFGTGLHEFRNSLRGQTSELRDELNGIRGSLDEAKVNAPGDQRPTSADDLGTTTLTRDHDAV